MVDQPLYRDAEGRAIDINDLVYLSSYDVDGVMMGAFTPTPGWALIPTPYKVHELTLYKGRYPAARVRILGREDVVQNWWWPTSFCTLQGRGLAGLVKRYGALCG